MTPSIAPVARRVRYSAAMSLDGCIAGPNGGGVPLLPPPSSRATLMLAKHTVFEKTETVMLDYLMV